MMGKCDVIIGDAVLFWSVSQTVSILKRSNKPTISGMQSRARNQARLRIYLS